MILGGNRGAAFNMAVDEAILRACAGGDIPPTLRLYGFKRPAISLGYFQNVERARIDIQYCRDAGIELVRRPTGGRAVLHGHDLTFSIVLHERRIPDSSKNVPSSHVWLVSGILAGLRLLGIQAEIGPNQSDQAGRGDSADCFAHVAQCDLRVGMRKVAGAAQVRKWGALLEQGSIPHMPLHVDYERVFVGGSSNPQSERSPLLEVSREALEKAIVRGYEQSLDIHFEPTALSAGELETAVELEKSKYAAADSGPHQSAAERALTSRGESYRIGCARIDNGI